MTSSVVPLADAEVQKGLEFHRQGCFDRAQSHYRQALQWQPQHFRALQLMGVLALQMQQPQKALEVLSQAAQVQPHDLVVHMSLGAAHAALGRNEAAVSAYDRAIALAPGIPEAHFDRGNALRALGRNAEAALSFERALALNPNNPGARNNLGITLFESGRPEAALACYEQALALAPAYADAHYNRGNALFELKQYQAAAASFERALELDPHYVAAHLNRGGVLYKLRRYQDAVDSYDRVLAMAPGHAAAYCNRGSALLQLQRHAAAVDSYDRAIALQPDYGEAYYKRGDALRELRSYEAAIASYDRALALGYAHGELLALRLSVKTQICDWNGLQADVDRLAAKTARHEAEANPFLVLSLHAGGQLQRSAAERWVRIRHPIDHALPPLQKRGRHERLRIGYFSADLRAHPVACLIAGVFEAHDRSRFELTAFSYGPDTIDDTRRRIERSFEHFLDVRAKSDREIAQLARHLEIDIAVDLNGFTQHGRPDIFALRAAPLQISYLGYPGTTGAPYMDYLIADRTLVPEGNERFYSESLIYLPSSYQPNDDRRPIGERIFVRGELGLPQDAFVFCCFNNSFKILPPIFDSWMRILNQVEGSVLWLLQDNVSAARNLRHEAALRQVDPQRLIFAERLPMAEHLARQPLADLFLDTLPYNAHTTASDALWAGLPVLTCSGEAFASRVAGSLLHAIGLPELVTTTLQDYEALAVELARDPPRLQAIRQKLAAHRRSTPLFDTRLSARHLEAVYRQIYERYHAGLPPEAVRSAPQDA
jgi:predicted O-linked N-acetylglucosamine transferase (SPINDLY family)